MKVAFVVDSGTGRTIKEVEAFGCYSVPLQISYNDQSFLEYENITLEEVNKLLSENKILKTSLAPLGKIEELFTRLKNAGFDMIFAVPICSGLSGTLHAMQMVAKEVGIPFEYFDNHTVAIVQEYMIKRAKQLYDEGKTITEIKAVLQAICDTTNTLIVPDDLQHLRRGGRLTPFAATLGGLLKIKPILVLNESTLGKIDVLDKVRTMSRALDKTLDLMKKQIPNEGEGYSITVAHVLVEEAAKRLLEVYRQAFPKARLQVIDLVSVVAIHTGVGSIAIQYFKEV